MPQSLSRVLLHCVFGTKGRVPWIREEFRYQLHAYLGGIIRNHDCWPIEIGGAEDHVHVLLGLARTISVAEIVSALKANSSKWMKSQHQDLRDFQWQAGYAVFSVDPVEFNTLCQYIRNQKEHHRAKSFQDEYRQFLQQCGITFQERYVWD
jgi:putative transposase